MWWIWADGPPRFVQPGCKHQRWLGRREVTSEWRPPRACNRACFAILSTKSSKFFVCRWTGWCGRGETSFHRFHRSTSPCTWSWLCSRTPSHPEKERTITNIKHGTPITTLNIPVYTTEIENNNTGMRGLDRRIETSNPKNEKREGRNSYTVVFQT